MWECELTTAVLATQAGHTLPTQLPFPYSTPMSQHPPLSSTPPEGGVTVTLLIPVCVGTLVPS